MQSKNNIQKFDVIIAGASFAGLAVAAELNAKVLLIDRFEIGSHQISACGTLTKIMKKINCEKAIIQTFDTIAIHTENKEIDIPVVDRFCTIDYEKFCKLLFQQNKAKFLKATAKEIKDSTVITDKGEFQADIIVDCTGWEATLANSLRKNYTKGEKVSIGIETEIKYTDNKLRFFIDKNIIKNGAAWLFPAKKRSRFGVGSYVRNNHLLQDLEKFVSRYSLKIEKIHGGGFCYCFKDPVVENIFVVGCGAGQTLPLTGEGIRRSIHFGMKCGEIIQEIIDKKISLGEGLEKYKKIATQNKKYYRLLLKVQKKLPTIPNWQINLFAKILSFKPIAKYALKKYTEI